MNPAFPHVPRLVGMMRIVWLYMHLRRKLVSKYFEKCVTYIPVHYGEVVYKFNKPTNKTEPVNKPHKQTRQTQKKMTERNQTNTTTQTNKAKQTRPIHKTSPTQHKYTHKQHTPNKQDKHRKQTKQTKPVNKTHKQTGTQHNTNTSKQHTKQTHYNTLTQNKQTNRQTRRAAPHANRQTYITKKQPNSTPSTHPHITTTIKTPEGGWKNNNIQNKPNKIKQRHELKDNFTSKHPTATHIIHF